VYESIGDGTSSDSGGADSSWLLDSGSIYGVCKRSVQFKPK
jgi:hypothetical protein